VEKLIGVLIKRLEEKGMEPPVIHGFIRDLANAIGVNTHVNLLQADKRLHLLGWGSSELDYHTLELAIACFEAEDLKGWENKPARQFQINF